MTDRRFSSKPQSSLVRRILFTCMALLVLPLIFDSLLVYVHEYQARMRTFYVSLELVSLGQQNLVDEIVGDQIKELSRADAHEGEVLTIADGVFPEEVKKALDKGNVTFAALDPQTGQKKIYIGVALDKTRVRIVGVPAYDFVRRLIRLPGRPFDFHMAILLPNGSLFISDEPELSLQGVDYFSVPYRNKNFFDVLWKKSKKIGLKKPWEGTDLSFAYLIASDAVRSASAFSWLSNFLIVFFSVFFLGLLLTYLITRRMARPLQSLCEDMNNVGKGDLEVRYKKDPFGLEINTLGEAFNQMIASLVKQMEISKNERIAKEALATELKIGQTIQKSLLPTRVVEFPGLDIGAGFQAAQEVAGDFYDLFSAGGHLMIAVGDASGKGVSACLYSLGVRSLLRSFKLCYEDDLSKILSSTNAVFCKDTEDTQHFVTAWVGIFDPKTLKLDFGSAGHPPALLKRAGGEILELATAGIALGAIESESAETSSIYLCPGDVILMYSDGITEAQNEKDEFFGTNRLIQFLSAQKNVTAQQIVDNLIEEVERFSSDAPQYDDLTLLVMRIL